MTAVINTQLPTYSIHKYYLPSVQYACVGITCDVLQDIVGDASPPSIASEALHKQSELGVIMAEGIQRGTRHTVNDILSLGPEDVLKVAE